MNNNPETKLCRHCRSEMDVKATVCPNCHKSQRRGKGCIIAVIIVGILLILMGSCSKAVSDSLDKANESLDRAGESLEKANDSIDKAIDSVDKESDSVDKAIDSVDKENDSVKKENDSVNKASEKTNAQNTSANKVIFDENGLKVTYKEIKSDSFSTEIKLAFENNSDRSYDVTIDDFSIDGYSINALFYVQVASGKSANDKIDVLDSYLEDNGLSADSIKQVTMKIVITDFDSFDTYESDVTFDLR